MSNPDRIDKVIALSGYVNEDIFTYAKEGLEALRCFSSHGTQDPTIPVSWAQKGINQLKSYPLKVDFKEYQSGHGINPENFQDLIYWLNKNN